MRTRDFGGFSTRTCSIDLRFLEPRHFEHFVEAWTRPGPPSLDNCTLEEKVDLLSIGTTLEHELRHYHDFLLGYASLHNYWLRLQALLNSAPVIDGMLKSQGVSNLVFPIIKWAEMSRDERSAYLVDVLGDEFPVSGAWHPPVLRGPKPVSSWSDPTEMSPQVEEQLLYVIRDQMRVIEDVRSGLKSPFFPFPLSPRFASELSAFLVQCASVKQTYGIAELDLFMNRLAEDESLYAKFFCMMITIFSGKQLPDYNQSVFIDTQDVDWRALSVAATWCFCGYTQQPELLTTAQRLGRLIEAAMTDRERSFPQSLSETALLSHLDTYFDVEPAFSASQRNTEALRGFVARAKNKISTSKSIFPSKFLNMFECLINERERVVERLFRNPIEYLNLDIYVRNLPRWPQCPVSLDFRPAGFCVHKNSLQALGKNPRFSATYDVNNQIIEDAVAEVFYPSFLPGGTDFPLDDALDLAGTRDLFDMFFDPHQVGVDMEDFIRGSVREKWSKNLIRII